ncbi:penicillin-binding protein 1A [Commensalibacter communis]|uniref:penicillin-binding protein 1A n=1 Tax=Commensalibacter communis TaxID=2972786 RepID=UPI0022FF5910|nr:PBP1A family penicillin-binding protein [Commensalibacter communis]CAI3952939.1 Membrane carboxypeptidase/penicillin-binding protein (MrcA) (PDB:3D0F) [Commensalibacter communis]CAI3953499.1 Membrane carboxypeptidase/penicillin-binding protein (MrcA) (PDB:3D0F) [Commensalibacter communis]
MSPKTPDTRESERKRTAAISPRPRYRFWRILIGSITGLLLLVLVGGGLAVWIKYQSAVKGLPTIEGLRDYSPPVMSRIYSNDDQVVAELASERRLFVPIAAIPQKVKDAFISTEDKNFYTHGGVDPMAIGRALVQDVFRVHGKRLVGASTITQQVARNMLLNNDRKLERKIKEAILAMRIEQSLTKDQILEIYLNEIYLGAGAYGVAAAAQIYFHKNLDQLTTAEAAYLGGLPKSPYNYDLFRKPEAAKQRRNFVLSRMAETGAITQEEKVQAQNEPISSKSISGRRGPLAGTEWYAEAVRRDLIDRYGLEKTMQGGLEVHTSLNLQDQALATKLMRQALMKYDRNHGWRGAVAHLGADAVADWAENLKKQKAPGGMLPNWRLAMVLNAKTGEVGWVSGGGRATHQATILSKSLSWSKRKPLKDGDIVMVEPQSEGNQVELCQIPLIEGALVSLDVRTGRVLAMFGGWSFAESQFNRATQAQRQPGSSFKPIVYLAAMEKGILPSQIFMDSPFSVGDWHPNNYEKNFWGPTALHNGLRYSRNLVTIRLAAQIGMDAVANLSIALGEVDSMPKVLPAVLGAVETTVLRHAGAYASIAAGGVVVHPTTVDYIQDRNGKVIWRSDGFAANNVNDPNHLPTLTDNRKRVVSEQSSYQIITMMEDVMRRGTGFSSSKGIDTPIAGKTGTSQNFNDAWFAGFSPDVVTIVWFGFDTPKTLGRGMAGGILAGPVWNAYMKDVLPTYPKRDFIRPSGIVMASYSTSKGMVTDAFKTDQKPGDSINLSPGAATGTLSAADTGAENVPDSEENMGAGYSGDYVNEGGAIKPKTTPSSGGGEDIGMGGLY